MSLELRSLECVLDFLSLERDLDLRSLERDLDFLSVERDLDRRSFDRDLREWLDFLWCLRCFSRLELRSLRCLFLSRLESIDFFFLLFFEDLCLDDLEESDDEDLDLGIFSKTLLSFHTV